MQLFEASRGWCNTSQTHTNELQCMQTIKARFLTTLIKRFKCPICANLARLLKIYKWFIPCLKAYLSHSFIGHSLLCRCENRLLYLRGIIMWGKHCLCINQLPPPPSTQQWFLEWSFLPCKRCVCVRWGEGHTHPDMDLSMYIRLRFRTGSSVLHWRNGTRNSGPF